MINITNLQKPMGMQWVIEELLIKAKLVPVYQRICFPLQNLLIPFGSLEWIKKKICIHSVFRVQIILTLTA